jgi:Ni/Co efflux regulator RcnB
MKLSIMAAAAAALVSTSFAAAPADAQRGDRDGMRERTVVRTTVVHRDNGNHYGWRNNNRHRKVKVCRTVWRNHHRDRVCTWRYR